MFCHPRHTHCLPCTSIPGPCATEAQGQRMASIVMVASVSGVLSFDTSYSSNHDVLLILGAREGYPDEAANAARALFPLVAPIHKSIG